MAGRGHNMQTPGTECDQPWALGVDPCSWLQPQGTWRLIICYNNIYNTNNYINKPNNIYNTNYNIFILILRIIIKIIYL